MTIISVQLTQEGTSLSGDGDESRQKRSYSANYIVKTDDATSSTKAIEKHFKNNPPLPWYGRSWRWNGTNENDSDPDSICKKISIKHKPQSAGVFDVTAEFEPIDGDKQDKEKPSNNEDGANSRDPLEWRDQVSVSYTQISEPVMYAIFRGFTTGENGNIPANGTNALQVGRTYVPQNSALVPFDPLPEKETTIKVVRFVRNIPAFDADAYDTIINVVNADLIRINKRNLGFRMTIPALKGRIKQVSGSSDFQNGVSFFRREIEIWVNPNGWRGRLADMGNAVLATQAADEGFVSPGDLINNPGRAEQITLKDKDEYPLAAPILLDGFGRPLRSDKPTANIWTNWQYYPEKDLQWFLGDI